MRTSNLDEAAIVQELEELDRALDKLQHQFAHEDQENIKALQRLDADVQILDRLGEMLTGWDDEVDVFDALRLDGSEEFHSNFLA